MSDRQPFNKIVEDRAVNFCRALLAEVPELEGVAVVPSYQIPNDAVPFGFVIGRHGPIRTPNEVLHMSLGLHATLNYVMETTLTLLKNYDKLMGDLARDMVKLGEERDKLLEQRNAARTDS